MYCGEVPAFFRRGSLARLCDITLVALGEGKRYAGSAEITGEANGLDVVNESLGTTAASVCESSSRGWLQGFL